ncbi:unnamed protein product [Paramecium pentaurelia]|uniref:E3 ubiquitin protein ligase n=1 Tax=Paramecium pentaurelia TaxID=43138 RepID=A0A8S1SJ16_9CILI|nr:unnamed protein product [Paramecium pentaurelia]
MRSTIKPLPQINNRPSIDDEDSYPGRLHTIQRKLKFGSNTYIISSNTTVSESLNKKQKQTPVTESQLLRQIDTKLEMHKKDIEQRNDMIISIEKGFESMKQELVKEKIQNEEKSKQLQELQASYQAIQLRLKQAGDSSKLNLQSEKDKDKINSLEISIKQSQAKEQDLLQQVESLNQQISQYQEKLKSKEESNEEFKRLKDQLHKAEDLQSKMEHQITDIQKNIEKEVNEKNNIKKQYDQYRNDSQLKEQNLNKEISASLIQIKQLEQEKITIMENLKKSKEQTDQNSKLNEQILSLKLQLSELSKTKDKEISQLRQKIEEQSKNSIESNNQLEKLKQRQQELQQQLQDKLSQLESLKNQKQLLDQQNQNNQSEINNLNTKLEGLKEQLSKPKNTKQITDTILLLEKTDKDIQKNLSCTFCNKFIKQPVTIIPCGHSYCFECKKGYNKECFKCGPKLKIEAMYRNELLDDIIAMVKLIEQSINSMKQVTKQ